MQEKGNQKLWTSDSKNNRKNINKIKSIFLLWKYVNADCIIQFVEKIKVKNVYVKPLSSEKHYYPDPKITNQKHDDWLINI